jgi:hypothetical protein
MTGAGVPVTRMPAPVPMRKACRTVSLLAPYLAAAFGVLWTPGSFAQTHPARTSNAMAPYVAKRGDTLYDIAGRYLRDPSDWVTVSRLNHVPTPSRLQPGVKLLLPVELLRRDHLSARVVATSGPVEHAFRDGPFTPVSVDIMLTEGDRVRTGHNGFVTLELADGSHIGVPQDSTIGIDTLRQTALTGATDRVFDLREGEVRSEVTHATKKDDRFQIRSPSVVAGVRGTSFRVRYDRTGASTTTVEVLDGAVGVDAASRAPRAPGVPLQASAQLVTAHYGNLTRDSGAIGAPVPLLPTPALVDPAKLQAAREVAFDIVPQPEAQAWRVQIARDAGLLALIRETRVTEPQASFGDLPDGSYFVSLSAIDSHGLEGLPQVYAFERRQFGLAASAAPRTGTRDYEFRWFVSRQADSTRFRFVLADTADLSHPLIDRTDLEGGELVVKDLPRGVYYWTVIAEQFDNGKFYETGSAVRSFTLAY